MRIVVDVNQAPMTVVETRRFLDDAVDLFSDEERAQLIAYVGTHPSHGDVVPDSGGVRKLRWSRAGMGKRGGARVIYYFQNDQVPLFLLAAYAKNERGPVGAGTESTEATYPRPG